MKLVVIGKWNGKKVFNWPLAVLWILLTGCAAALAAFLIYVVVENSQLVPRADLDILWFAALLVPLAMFFGGIAPLWLRWRRPLEQLPDRQKAPSAFWNITNLSWKRLSQTAVFGAVCIATLVALFYAVENWRGKRAYLNHKRALEAKGQQLEWSSFVPPPIPENQNMAMTPLLKGMFDYEKTPHGIVWHDQTGIERLKKPETIFKDTGKNRMPGLGNLDRNGLVPILDYQTYFQNSTNVPHPARSLTPAEDVLFALRDFDPELQELKAAATTHPLMQFPIHYQDNWACLLPHLARLKPIFRYLTLHAIASLQAGRTQTAFEDLQLSHRLTDAFGEEPFVISHLVRISGLSMSSQIVKEGLVRHQWTPEQLQWIQRRCQKIDLLADVAKSLDAERAFCIQGLDLIRRGEVPVQVMLEDDQDVAPFSDFFHSPLTKLIPNGWYYQNMLSISELHGRFLQSGIDAEQHRVDPAVAKAGDPFIKQLRTTPYNIFAKVVTPALMNIAIRTARWQTAMDHVAMACALERYRLAHQSYPESLNDLQPEWIAKLPHDVITGDSYQYRKTETDYVLYSVGWNGKDDGGVVAAGASGKTVDGKKGDWVWSLTPTPPVKLK